METRSPTVQWLSRQRPRAGGVVGALVVAMAVLTAGCPTYEEEFTGHYQELELEEFQDEAVALDLFRFGDRIRGIFRHYDISSSTARQAPFDESNEVLCRWTDVGQFDAGTGEFSLTIPLSAEWDPVQLDGRVDDGSVLDLEITEEGAGEGRTVEMAPADRAPDRSCQTIDDFLIRAIFDDDETGLDPDVYQIRNPVFSILWVGLEQSGQRFVELEDPSPAFRFSEDPGAWTEDNGVRGNMSINVPPPAEQMLVDSGETRYALAHYVVIDDNEDQGSFTWDVGNEPVVATALERGVPDDVPEQVEQRAEQEDLELDRWGRALLFVEGDLEELGETLRREILIGVDEAAPDQHFYIVDIFSYYEDQVDFIRLPPRPRAERPVQRRVPVQVTDEHLEDARVPVPRLYLPN